MLNIRKTSLFTLAVIGLAGCAESPVNSSATKKDIPSEEAFWMIVEPAYDPSAPVIPPGMNANDRMLTLHHAVTQEFIIVDDRFGFSRMPRMQMRHGTVPDSYKWAKANKYHFSELDQKLGADVQWQMKNMQLVGLDKQPQGIAYLIPENAAIDMAKLKDVSTRPLGEFENEALKQLQSGQNNVAFVEHDRVRMLGAIRLQSQCVQCHQKPAGTLVGAFTYDFARDPEPYTPSVKNDAQKAPILP